MEITNKTKRFLVIPLPGGKKLHLGPKRVGEINSKAKEYPPVKKLLEAGDIEIVQEGRSSSSQPGSEGPGKAPTKGTSNTSGMRHTGDR